MRELIIVFIINGNHCNHTETYVYDTGVPGLCIGFIGGVHGNERSGSVELLDMVRNGYFEKNLKSGSVKVIPEANRCGLFQRIRYSGVFGINGDLNRKFGNDVDNGLALYIIRFFNDCDIVVDFHESWGWNKIDSKSIGATLTPTTPLSEMIANDIANNINELPEMKRIIKSDKRKSFEARPYTDSCSIKNTLRCWMGNNKRNYLLVEIPGQRNIQPMKLRRLQVKTVVDSII